MNKLDTATRDRLLEAFQEDLTLAETGMDSIDHPKTSKHPLDDHVKELTDEQPNKSRRTSLEDIPTTHDAMVSQVLTTRTPSTSKIEPSNKNPPTPLAQEVS